jgi:HEAT repeat protein
VKTSVDRQLGDLERLADSLDEPDAGERLRPYLASRSSVVAARAAELARRVPDHGLESELVATFRRFMKDAEKTDKGCLAKMSAVEALLAGEDSDPDVLRTGLRHRQFEPTWGGSVDTAAPLRAHCALGLVQIGADGVLDDLAELLADPEGDARLGAARALAACGDSATPLLRFKVLTGDEQPLVVAECLSGLMAVAPNQSFDFVAALVDPSRGDLAGHAAMALAEARAPGAFELLVRRWEDAFLAEFRQGLLLPIGLTRHDGAPGFLLSVLESGDLAAATSAIAALAIYKGDPGVGERAREAIRGPHRSRLLSFLDKAFDQAL